MPRSFGLLVCLFRDRLFEDDSAGPGSGFQTNIYQILGFLLAAGWFIAYFLTPQLMRLSTGPASPQRDWTIFTLHMLFTSFSFAIVGFAAVFEWDTLFPDRRDFLILGTLPVTPWQMFAARLVAVGSLLLLLVGAFNIFPVGMMLVLSILVPSLHGLGWKLVIAQLAATTRGVGVRVAGRRRRAGRTHQRVLTASVPPSLTGDPDAGHERHGPLRVALSAVFDARANAGRCATISGPGSCRRSGLPEYTTSSFRQKRYASQHTEHMV